MSLEKQEVNLINRVDNLEQYQRRNNGRIFDMIETFGETKDNLVTTCLRINLVLT